MVAVEDAHSIHGVKRTQLIVGTPRLLIGTIRRVARFQGLLLRLLGLLLRLARIFEGRVCRARLRLQLRLCSVRTQLCLVPPGLRSYQHMTRTTL